MKILLCCLACAIAGCASLPPETRVEETTYQLTAAVDAMQTLRTADEPQKLRELNPILGAHPQPAKVAVYFAAGAALHYAITSALVEHDAPPWAIRAWEWSGITLEVACVGNNAAQGIVPTLSFHVTTLPFAQHKPRYK